MLKVEPDLQKELQKVNIAHQKLRADMIDDTGKELVKMKLGEKGSEHFLSRWSKTSLGKQNIFACSSSYAYNFLSQIVALLE